MGLNLLWPYAYHRVVWCLCRYNDGCDVNESFSIRKLVTLSAILLLNEVIKVRFVGCVLHLALPMVIHSEYRTRYPPPNPRSRVLSAWFWKLWCTSFGEYGYMVSHYPLRIRWREMAFRGHCISAEASLSELLSIWKRSHWMHWSFAMRCSECFTHIWGKSTTPP